MKGKIQSGVVGAVVVFFFSLKPAAAAAAARMKELSQGEEMLHCNQAALDTLTS